VERKANGDQRGEVEPGADDKQPRRERITRHDGVSRP
jgi:hypothetical protein